MSPAGWEQTTLGEVLDRLQYGYTASASPDLAGPRFLRITDLQDRGVDWSSVPGCQVTEVDLEKYRLRDGDIVFARSGSIEKAWRVKDAPSAVFASYLIRGTPLIPAVGGWLEAFVKSASYLVQIGAAGAGSGMQNVNATNLGQVELPLPPLNEQRRIVAKLEAIFEQTKAAKVRLDRLPTLLDSLKRSILAAAFRGELTKDWRRANPEVEPAIVLLDRTRTERRRLWEAGLRAKGKDPKKATYNEPADIDVAGLPELPAGWTWMRMEELAKSASNAICAGPFGTIFKAKDFRAEGVPIIFLRHVKPDLYLTRKPGFMDRAKWKELFVPYSVFGGELLVTKLGDPPGDCAVFPAETGPAMVTPDVIKIDVNREVFLPRLLMHAINSPTLKKLMDKLSYGATRQRINLDVLRQVPVPVPPMSEQMALLQHVDSALRMVGELAQRVERQALAIAQCEQAALTAAFRGDLVPQDPADEPASLLLDRIRAARAARPERPRGGHGRRGDTVARPAAPSPSNGHATNGHDESLDLVAAMFQVDRRLTATAIANGTGLESSAVKKALKVLVDNGQVSILGKPRSATYIWTG